MPQEAEDTTEGGLIIPPSAQDEQRPEVGEVIKLGTGEKDFEFSVDVGDTVFFKQFSPDKIELEGEVYYIIDEEDILAVIS